MNFLFFRKPRYSTFLLFFLLAIPFPKESFAAKIWLDCSGTKFWLDRSLLEEQLDPEGFFSLLLKSTEHFDHLTPGTPRDGSTEEKAIRINVDGKLFKKYILPIFHFGRVCFSSEADARNTLDICNYLEFPKAESFISKSLGFHSRREKLAIIERKEAYLGNFVSLPGGKFMMGSPDEEPGRDEDETLHEVELSPFELGETVINQAAVIDFLDRNPATFQTAEFCPETYLEMVNEKKQRVGYCPTLPADNMTREIALELITQVNTHLAESDFQYRLATEAELEYALRAGVTDAYLSGESPEGLEAFILNKKTSVVKRTGRRQPTVHSLLKPNAFGIYWPGILEWASDYYAPWSKDPVKDPQGPHSTRHYVARGAHFAQEKADQRIAARYAFSDRETPKGIGLRLVRIRKSDDSRMRIMQALFFDSGDEEAGGASSSSLASGGGSGDD